MTQFYKDSKEVRVQKENQICQLVLAFCSPAMNLFLCSQRIVFRTHTFNLKSYRSTA